MVDWKPHKETPFSPSASTVGDLLVGVADKVLDADRCSFLVDGGNHFEIVATTRVDSERTYPKGTSIPAQAFDARIACVIDDRLDTRSASAAQPTSSVSVDRVRSLCCVPVENIGLLLGEAYRADAFTEDEKDVLTRVVDTLLESSGDLTADVQPVEDGGRPLDDESDRFEQIADILSHDLKGPLAVVGGNIELARETGDEMYLQRAADALNRVHEMLDEVILLARTGELTDNVESVDLEATTRSAWASVQTRDATLDVVGSASIEADERVLRHLLGNLLTNAVVHAGPDVTVRVGPLERGFFVEDDGPGIPADERHRIFDRGISLDQESTGFGLHIVHQIAEAHGWEISVSEAESGGARFEIRV